MISYCSILALSSGQNNTSLGPQVSDELPSDNHISGHRPSRHPSLLPPHPPGRAGEASDDSPGLSLSGLAPVHQTSADQNFTSELDQGLSVHNLVRQAFSCGRPSHCVNGSHALIIWVTISVSKLSVSAELNLDLPYIQSSWLS